jgi:intracellular septation protein
MTEPQNPKLPETGEEAKPEFLKIVVELAPLVVFIVVNSLTKNLFYGTAACMVATLASLIASKTLFGRVPVMALVSAGLLLVFGGLTLWLQDEVFIKLKPTILYTLFAAALAIGLLLKQFFLRYAFGEVFKLSDRGWQILTMRWICFFLTLALVNELVWRNLSNDLWLWFKVAVLPITAVFTVSQLHLLKQHAIEPSAG